MNNQSFIIENLLPVAISLMVLWVAYRLLFTNSNRFQFNRFYLLTAMLFSLTLPLLGVLMSRSTPQVAAFKENLFNGTVLNEITISYGGESSETTLPEIVITGPSRMHVTVWQVLGAIYLIGVAVTALLFLFKMGKLVAMIIRSPKRKMEGYTMVFTHKEHGPYSFFRYAFFTDEQVDPTIVRHELSHIAHHHSWDILMVELMKIFQWFNPFIYLYKRELQSLHEYIADNDVVATGADKRNYMMLILQQCTAVDFSNMSNNFSLILTKKRIKMITKHEKAKGFWWKLLATIPVLAVLLVANTKVTAQEKSAVDDPKELTIEMGEVEIFHDDGTPLQFKDTVIYNPDGSYIKCEVTDAFDPISGEPRKKMTITTFNTDETPNYTFNIKPMEKHGDTVCFMVEPFSISMGEGHQTKITSDDLNIKMVQKSNDSIFQIVEKMPEFPGGAEAMMNYLSGNIKYPEEAKEKGVSGRVFINFVIEKDGSVSNAKVMRSIGGGCDEEALRVVNAMPKWKPGVQKGKPVRVSYMLPINFKLDDSVKNKGLAGTTWEGTGKGTKDKVNYTMNMTMEIESPTAGYFVMNLESEKKGKTTVEFEDVGLPFTYTYDGKSMGSINPINPDGSAMTAESQPPYGFTIDDKGNMIVNFYDMKDIGVEKIVFSKKKDNASKPVGGWPANQDKEKTVAPQADLKPDKDGIWSIAETMPEYPGGLDAMRTFIQENLTVPEKYKEMDAKAEYRVFVQFVVAEDGSVTNVELLKPEPSKKDLNDEALRVVKAMPKWKPGTVDGKPVRVRYVLPVTYKLGK